MKNKAFIVALLFIAGSWLVHQFTQTHFHRRTRNSRYLLISLTRNEIEKIEESMNENINESISKKDILSIIEIDRLEGRIRGLKMENAIDRAKKSPEDDIIGLFTIILLVAISMKIGLIDKKYQMNLP